MAECAPQGGSEALSKVGAVVVWLAGALALAIGITAIIEDFREVFAWWLLGGLAAPWSVVRVVIWIAVAVGTWSPGWWLWTESWRKRAE